MNIPRPYPFRELFYVSFDGLSTLSDLIKIFSRSSSRTHIATLRNWHGDWPLIEAWTFDGHWTNTRWGISNFSFHTPGTYYEVWSLKVSVHCAIYCMQEYERFAREKRPYDFKALFSFLLYKNKENPVGAMCSEGEVEPLAHFLKWFAVEPYKVTPQFFIQLIQAAGARVVTTGVTDGTTNPLQKNAGKGAAISPPGIFKAAIRHPIKKILGRQ